MFRYLLLTATCFLIGSGGCSSSTNGPGDVADAPMCTMNSECESGECSDGKCVEFWIDPDISEPDVSLDGGGGEDIFQIPGEDTIQTEEDSNDEPPPPGGSILVDPDSYTFTYLPGGSNAMTTEILIYNQGSGSLNISALYWKEGSSPEFTFMALPPLPKKLNPFEHTAVTVIFQEGPEHAGATLVVESDDPLNPISYVEFNSMSKVTDLACISLSPSTLNFGQVVRGESKVMDFQIINCSPDTLLTISEVERSTSWGMALTDEFQFVPPVVTPMMLSPGQAAPWQMEYSPGLAGADNGYFLFHSNDLQQPEAKLSVSGVGVPPAMEDIGFHIELEWDSNDCDVDLHLLQPGGSFFDCSDCYFSNPSPDWGAQGDTIDDPFLDYDDVDGFGPENINLQEPAPGTYRVLIHYYSDSGEWGGSTDTNATVRVFSYGQLIGEFGPVNLDQTDRNWDVCDFTWPSGAITTLGNTYMVGSSDKGSCGGLW